MPSEKWFWCSLHQVAENAAKLELPGELPYHAHVGPFASRMEAEEFPTTREGRDE